MNKSKNWANSEKFGQTAEEAKAGSLNSLIG